MHTHLYGYGNMLNERSKESNKYVNLHDTTIRVLDILKFAKRRNIPVENLKVSDYRQEDVCRHWTSERYEFNDCMLYKGLSVDYLATVVNDLKNIDLDNSTPIIVINRNYVLDGVHRLLKALVDGREYISGINLYEKDVCELLEELES